MIEMFFNIFTENKNIIKIAKGKGKNFSYLIY